MRKKSPRVALIWMYQGKDASARRDVVEKLAYPAFDIVEVGKDQPWSSAIRAVPDKTEVCVFWMDDDKPVGKDFIDQMTRPLISGEDLRAVMHFWSGNAISIPKKMLDASTLEADQPGIQSLLKLLLPALDVAEKQPNGRVHLAFSSTERLAPMSMDPVGFPS